MRKITSLAERLAAGSRRDLKTGCILWTKYGLPSGYGLLYTGNGHAGTHKGHLTHRVAYELAYGPIPEGFVVCHKCDTPACVNPDHLFVGTQAANILDKVLKGRQQKGETHVSSKLSQADVLEIRKLAAAGVTQRELARRFGTHFGNINAIVLRKSWRHV